MKHKLLLAFVAAFALMACNGDEIDDLKKRLNKVENIIGSNEPISIRYSTTDGNDADIVKNKSFYFKSTDWETSYAGDNGDGTYYIYIERFSDVDWQDGASFDFYYDSNTGEVEVNQLEAYFEHESGQYQNVNFYSWAGENEMTVTVKSFDPETGKIDITAVATSTSAYEYNEYSGKPMTLNMSFKGKVGVFPNINL